MKLTIEQAALQKALRRVVSVVPRRNTIPVLANVLIDAETEAAEGRIWIVATDLDMEAKVGVEARIDRPGRVTIEADRLTNIVSAAPGGADILLDWDTVKDPRVSLAFGRSRYSLSALPADVFPVWSIRDWSHRLSVRAFDLAQMLARSSFAASPEITRGERWDGLVLAAHFGDGELQPSDVAASLVGAVIKDPVTDRVAWEEYLEAVARQRRGWGDLYAACRELL